MADGENSLDIDDLKLSVNKCILCEKGCAEKICSTCREEYVIKIQVFLAKHPGITYLHAVFHKELPIPRDILYALQENGIIQLPDK